MKVRVPEQLLYDELRFRLAERLGEDAARIRLGWPRRVKAGTRHGCNWTIDLLHGPAETHRMQREIIKKFAAEVDLEEV
jgi:hypothetical protein